MFLSWHWCMTYTALHVMKVVSAVMTSAVKAWLGLLLLVTVLSGCSAAARQPDEPQAVTPENRAEEALNLAHVLRDNGRLQAAYEVYARMDQRGELAGQYLLEFATLASRVRPPQDALQLYARAAKVLPEPRADKVQLALCLGQGQAHLALGQVNAAAHDMRCALKVSPDNVQALNGRGVVYNLQGQNQQAQADFSRALQLDPGFTPALNNLALAHLVAGDIKQAINVLQPASQHGGVALRLNLALAYVLNQQSEQARQLLAERLKADYVSRIMDRFEVTASRIAGGASVAHELLLASQQPLPLKDQP